MTLILISPGRILMTIFYYYYRNVVAIYVCIQWNFHSLLEYSYPYEIPISSNFFNIFTYFLFSAEISIKITIDIKLRYI